MTSAIDFGIAPLTHSQPTSNKRPLFRRVIALPRTILISRLPIKVSSKATRRSDGGHRIIWTIADLYGEEVTVGFASPWYVSLLAARMLYSDTVMPMYTQRGSLNIINTISLARCNSRQKRDILEIFPRITDELCRLCDRNSCRCISETRFPRASLRRNNGENIDDVARATTL